MKIFDEFEKYLVEEDKAPLTVRGYWERAKVVGKRKEKKENSC